MHSLEPKLALALNEVASLRAQLQVGVGVGEEGKRRGVESLLPGSGESC